MARQECDYYGGRQIDFLTSSTTLESALSITPEVYNQYDFLLFKANAKSNGTEIYRSNQILVPTIEFTLADSMPSGQFSVCAGDAYPVGSSGNLFVYLILKKATCCSYWFAQFSNSAQTPNLSYVIRVYGIKQ